MTVLVDRDVNHYKKMELGLQLNYKCIYKLLEKTDYNKKMRKKESDRSFLKLF